MFTHIVAGGLVAALPVSAVAYFYFFNRKKIEEPREIEITSEVSQTQEFEDSKFKKLRIKMKLMRRREKSLNKTIRKLLRSQREMTRKIEELENLISEKVDNKRGYTRPPIQGKEKGINTGFYESEVLLSQPPGNGKYASLADVSNRVASDVELVFNLAKDCSVH